MRLPDAACSRRSTRSRGRRWLLYAGLLVARVDRGLARAARGADDAGAASRTSLTCCSSTSCAASRGAGADGAAGASSASRTTPRRSRCASASPSPRSAAGRRCEARRLPGVGEAMIVSTCNRVEVYAGVDDARRIAGAASLASSTERALPASLRAHLYVHDGEAAVRHLFRVAASLDSMVVGEPQILGQVKEAYDAALERGHRRAGCSAARCRARSRRQARAHRDRRRAQLGVDRVGGGRSGGADLRRTRGPAGAGGRRRQDGRRCGAPPAARRASARCSVVNRTLARAEELARAARRQRARRGTSSSACSPAADIVLCSTGARRAGHRTRARRQAMQRAQGALALLHRHRRAARRRARRSARSTTSTSTTSTRSRRWSTQNLRRPRGARREAPRRSSTTRWSATPSRASLGVVPTIRALRERFPEIALAEAERTLGAQLDERTERAAVQALAEAIVNKLLHAPLTALKREAPSPTPTARARCARCSSLRHRRTPRQITRSTAPTTARGDAEEGREGNDAPDRDARLASSRCGRRTTCAIGLMRRSSPGSPSSWWSSRRGRHDPGSPARGGRRQGAVRQGDRGGAARRARRRRGALDEGSAGGARRRARCSPRCPSARIRATRWWCAPALRARDVADAADGRARRHLEPAARLPAARARPDLDDRAAARQRRHAPAQARRRRARRDRARRAPGLKRLGHGARITAALSPPSRCRRSARARSRSSAAPTTPRRCARLRRSHHRTTPRIAVTAERAFLARLRRRLPDAARRARHARRRALAHRRPGRRARRHAAPARRARRRGRDADAARPRARRGAARAGRRSPARPSPPPSSSAASSVTRNTVAPLPGRGCIPRPTQEVHHGKGGSRGHACVDDAAQRRRLPTRRSSGIKKRSALSGDARTRPERQEGVACDDAHRRLDVLRQRHVPRDGRQGPIRLRCGFTPTTSTRNGSAPSMPAAR